MTILLWREWVFLVQKNGDGKSVGFLLFAKVWVWGYIENVTMILSCNWSPFID